MTKTRNRFNLYTISEARNVIFGIATLWIGLFHSDFTYNGVTSTLSLEPYTTNQFLIDAFKAFRGWGNAGVDMFLFLSGIGLYFSFSKDSHVVTFWKKRLMRVLPSSVLIAVVYFTIRYIITQRLKSGFTYYLSRLTFTYFFIKGERVFWFISLILVLYIVFPVFYRIIERFRVFGMLGLVALTVGFTFLVRAKWSAPDSYFAYWEIALCRVPGFIIGIWAGKFVKEKKEISRHWLWLFVALTVGACVLMYNYEPMMRAMIPGYNKSIEYLYIWLYRYEGTVMGVSLVVLDAYVITELRKRGQCNTLRNFFEFVGMYSLEYYMIYLNVVHYIGRVLPIAPKHRIMLFFGGFVISLVLCILARKISDFFMAYMQRKPKEPASIAPVGENCRWYEFLIYVGLYVIAAVTVFTGVTLIAGGRAVIGAAYFGVAVLAVLTRICLAKRTTLGPILLYLLIASIPAIRLISKALNTKLIRTMLKGGKKAILSTGMIVAITAAIIIANVIYFNKRKALFEKKQ